METELKQEFDITHAPELKLFYEGNRLEPISCKGNGDWDLGGCILMGSHWQLKAGYVTFCSTHFPVDLGSFYLSLPGAISFFLGIQTQEVTIGSGHGWRVAILFLLVIRWLEF